MAFINMHRFEKIDDGVEDVEKYRRGGYHPVQLGDVFNQRYRVIGKLAFGQFSTVWLARDQLRQGQVALKILKADASTNSNEASTLLELAESSHPGKRHVIELLDSFTHDGPNGRHLCLVLPVMVSDGQGMADAGKPHQVGCVRAIARQLVLGLDFLHSLGIVHCDLQPANIMVSLDETIYTEQLLEPPEFRPVRWLEGMERDDSAPEYLVTSQRPRGQLDDADFATLMIKIGDLGGGIRVKNALSTASRCNEWPVTPTAIAAPELVNRGIWDASIDIWALGCLIFELATNAPLFPLQWRGLTPEEVDQGHLDRVDRILQTDASFTQHLTERLPSDFGTENIQQLSSLLLLMLQKNPKQRVSTGDLLCHPFLTI
ncbi:hypothetical protein MW887_004098 [Aspergillus wentii]|nr:hypothetical protein MW887_004098 [Aspergillus wentii]